MRTEEQSASTPTVKYLKDYSAPNYWIDKTFLQFDIQQGFTVVSSQLHMRRNVEQAPSDLVLDGQEVELLSLSVDGKALTSDQYHTSSDYLTINAEVLNETFILSVQTKIDPIKNTALEGLYKSSTMYCTQCEAEGFRKITYYLDRPDVMSEFETNITAPAGLYQTMLSNGNCISDEIVDGKRSVTWHDPHKKPCYLFALVAGNLSKIDDNFTTMSGREVKLEIFVEEKDVEKCDHAMDSLKRSMRWDEKVYGREYDLDIFMIVAVDDFNMGAMENKGLNIFNTSCVLAHSDTTTDAGFQRVEAVVAHEYFHNWSGNRVTCRDWFQLSLKEGFTVYRDSEFSADMNSRSVKRIEDANFLRAHQFVEDAGPMAHAIRPASFIEISNFYTLTIYEKGAEVVRMLANLLGAQAFRSATDLYFERHDGQAATCEDFVKAMEDSSGIDLSQFRRWYDQAGTPKLEVTDCYDENTQQYSLTIEQSTPDTPGQKNKQPLHIPVKIALLGSAGHFALNIDGEEAFVDSNDNTQRVLNVCDVKQTFVFNSISEKPVPSLLREFSAPVNFSFDYTQLQLLDLIARDDDGFSRFNAVQSMLTQCVQRYIQGEDIQASVELLAKAFQKLLADEHQDPALLALLMTLPAQAYLSEQLKPANPLRIYAACQFIKRTLVRVLGEDLLQLVQRIDIKLNSLAATNDSLSGQSIALRSLKHTAFELLVELNKDQTQLITVFTGIVSAQFSAAKNMTETIAALKCLLSLSSVNAASALDEFYQRFSHESLVVNMWFQLQASTPSETALEHVKALMQHAAFDFNNPNKLRALIGGFCGQNTPAFHHESGSGYEFLADQIILLNLSNPQIASRMVAPLTHWKKLQGEHSHLMRKALQRIADTDQLSKDVYEVVSKSLNIE